MSPKLPMLFTYGGLLALFAGVAGLIAALGMQLAHHPAGEIAKVACVAAVLGLFGWLIGLEMWNEADKRAEAMV